MSKRYIIPIIVLLLVTLLAIAVMAAPPAWVKEKKGKTVTIPTTTAKTTPTPANATTQQKVAAGAQPAVNATGAMDLRAMDWGAISVAIAIIGALIGWYFSRKTRSKSASYLKEIDGAYRRFRDAPMKLDSTLSELRERIEQDFEKGKLTDQSLALLDARIDKYAKEARVDAIATGFRLPKDIKKQIRAMLDDGIITEEEYDQFTEMDLAQLPQKDYERLTRLMRKWKERK